MANFCALVTTAFLSFAALILAIVACAGSTSNYDPINKIYAAQLDLSDLNVDAVLANVSSSASSLSLSSLGLPSYINVGLWSYCLADASGDVTNCTSPSGIQQFNLRNLLYDNIDNNQVLELIDSVSQLVLPEKLQDNLKYYNDLVKCMFITLIIGIVASFINFALNIVRWLLHFLVITWFARFFSLVAFLSLIISAGTSTGTYVYIKHVLSDNYDDYGISLDLGRNFYALLWASVAAALLNLITWFAVRSKRYAYVQPIEEKPLV
ncbi:LAFE_0E08658g1_1 [Lachancea fermentati]|uniref:LAFE_0E08658g1_1 n=1 Tax=Lachancea fermentati TaxID=4955 RepID=A0A1G4MD86_LACFM|nr:LAFE_0E08658g1_1 [Lachancea fermentati]